MYGIGIGSFPMPAAFPHVSDNAFGVVLPARSLNCIAPVVTG